MTIIETIEAARASKPDTSPGLFDYRTGAPMGITNLTALQDAVNAGKINHKFRSPAALCHEGSKTTVKGDDAKNLRAAVRAWNIAVLVSWGVPDDQIKEHADKSPAYLTGSVSVPVVPETVVPETVVPVVPVPVPVVPVVPVVSVPVVPVVPVPTVATPVAAPGSAVKAVDNSVMDAVITLLASGLIKPDSACLTLSVGGSPVHVPIQPSKLAPVLGLLVS